MIFSNKNYVAKIFFLVIIVSNVDASHKINFFKIYSNKITIQFPPQKKATQFIGSTNHILSIVINGTPQTPISIKYTNTASDSTAVVEYETPMTDCSELFNGCSKITYIDLSEFDTSQCTTFQNLFYNCQALTSVKLSSSFTSSNVQNMAGMFNYCKVLKFDMSLLDTSKVTDMSAMFESSGFKFLDLTNFDTRQVTSMERMFNAMSNIVSIDMTSFDTSKVQSMASMFNNCGKLVSLQLNNFDLSSVGSNTANMFNGLTTTSISFCTEDTETLKDLLSSTKIKITCDSPCFTNSINKFNSFECVESCQQSANVYEYDNQCYSACPKKTKLSDTVPYLCIDIIDCSKSYYNLLQTECIDEVPEGYYCNDEKARTIAKCPDKCKTCSKDSAEAGLCLTCDNEKNFYIKEQDRGRILF